MRRIKVDPDAVRADPRSRRRRTIAADQLALALAGISTKIYAYSFILTNLAAGVEYLELRFRERAFIEETTRRLQTRLRPGPPAVGIYRVHRLWMWSAYLATNLSVFTQSLGRVDQNGRAHGKRARRELFCLPARVLRHARGTVVRFATGTADTAFKAAWANLRALPDATHG